MKQFFQDINKAFDNKIRLGIMSVLMVNEFVDFTELKQLMSLTDGNLASHVKALEKVKYINVNKSFLGRKPNTKYSATDLGKIAFKKHVDALEKILKGGLG
jgi:predicted transcriptional regulator